ncbi:MAG: Hpt domain-containing protein [Nitrospirae bacterium]|nr:Hpt domain-containing protein [Nitrospirota bacterium]
MQKTPELYTMFIESARMWIIEFESTLLDFEKFPQDRELFNNMFRVVHNLKGSSGNVGLTDICKFAHSMEDSLDLLRQNKLEPDKQLIDSFFKAIDLVSDMVEAAAIPPVFDFSRCGVWVTHMDTLKMKELPA